MSEHAIDARGLTKIFDGISAVESVDLQVRRGELFGLLGPNGAGKTTLISMLSTTLRPTRGEASVWGHDVRKDPLGVRRSIGIVFQDTTLDDRLTARENLDIHGRLYGMNREHRNERIAAVLELVELSNRADDLVKNYSGGMMRRLEIARGLMHKPRVLFLDEPTLGLDPQTRNHIWDYIQELNKTEGVTMVLTTHYMDEADHLCDRIAIIDQGKIVALDQPESLKDSLGGDLISLTVAKQDIPCIQEVFGALEWVEKIKAVDGTVDISVRDGERAIPRVLDIARSHEVSVEAISLRKPTLDDVFLHYTGRSIREESGSEMDQMRFRWRARR